MTNDPNETSGVFKRAKSIVEEDEDNPLIQEFRKLNDDLDGVNERLENIVKFNKQTRAMARINEALQRKKDREAREEEVQEVQEEEDEASSVLG